MGDASRPGFSLVDGLEPLVWELVRTAGHISSLDDRQMAVLREWVSHLIREQPEMVTNGRPPGGGLPAPFVDAVLWAAGEIARGKRL